jgi:hypothetical protein
MTSEEVLKELRAAAKARRRRKSPAPEPKPRRAPSQTALILRAPKTRGARDPEFSRALAGAINVYGGLAGEWCAGTRRPSPKRLRQIRQFLSEYRGDVSSE